MDYGISVTVDLHDLDTETFKRFDEGYHEKISAIEEDLWKLDGVETVMFGHMAWIKFDMGTDNFKEAASDLEVVKKEIFAVFKKHGVEL